MNFIGSRIIDDAEGYRTRIYSDLTIEEIDAYFKPLGIPPTGIWSNRFNRIRCHVFSKKKLSIEQKDLGLYTELPEKRAIHKKAEKGEG